MKKLILWTAMILFSVWAANAQTLPSGITKYLNANHPNWVKAPGFCEGKKWFLTGDFDGNKQLDYVVRFKVGKTAKTTRLYLVAFLNNGGKYTPAKIFEDIYKDDLLQSSFLIIKKGKTLNLGHGEEGQGRAIKLKTDAVTQFICETDGVITYIYKNGSFKNIDDQ